MAYYKCGSVYTTQNSNVVVDTSDGAIANFNTPLALPLIETKFGVKATQDLNGQSGPYPAGGGVNRWNGEWESGGISDATGIDYDKADTWRTAGYIPILPNTSYYICSPTGVSGNTIRARFYDSDKNYIGYSPARGNCAVNRSFVSPSSAAFLRFNPPNETCPNHDISVNYPSTDTDYHPYSNICPINGWDEISLTHCHKNLYQYDASKATTGTTSVGTTRSYLPLGLKGACTLTFSASLKEGQEPTVQFINIGKMVNGIITPLQALIQAGTIFTRTIPFNAGEEIVLVSASEQVFAITSSLPRYDIQIEVGSQATTYEAYNGSTTLINLGGTYYGGYVTQDKSGHRQLVVTHNIVDLGSLNWLYNSLNSRFDASGLQDSIKWATNVVASAKCSMYKTVTFNALYAGEDKTIAFDSRSPRIRDTAYTDATIFKTAVTGQKLVYELAEPIVIDLPDGTPIKSFPGINNIFCDTGDTSVKFRKIGE